MKIKKIILNLILLVISVCCMVGCADAELIRMVDSNGVIIDKLVVTLDKSKLDKSPSSSYVQVRTAIQDDMIMFRNYVGEWIDGFKEDYPDVYNALSKGIACQDPIVTDNKLSISIEFASWSHYGMFYGFTTLEDVEYEKAIEDIGPFINKIINEDFKTENCGLFLYKYSMINDSGIFERIKNFEIKNTNLNDKYTNMTKYSIDDLNISQIFAYPDDRLYSNADEQEVLGNMTFLAWDLSDKDKDFEMSIYKLAPRVIAWYVVGLLISILAIIFIFYLIRIKYKNVKREKITKQDVEKDER